MNGPVKRNRRTTLAIIGALFTLGAAPRGLAAVVPVSRQSAIRMPKLFRNVRSAVAVGRAYIGNATSERDLQGHVGYLNERNIRFDTDSEDGVVALRRHVDGHVRRDFAEGRIVDVDGWRMAETEMRLCAVAAIIDEQSS